MQPLVDVVRKTCLPGLWAQGVKLAREGAVSGREDRGDAVVVRVKAAGQAVAPTVTLYPTDGEWTCDCGGKVDPCAHVAAAAIAVAQALVHGGELAAPAPATAAAHVRYRLRLRSGGLALERTMVQPDGAEEPLKGSLVGSAGRAPKGATNAGARPEGIAALNPTHEDLAIDRMVGARQYGYYPADREPELFAALAAVADIYLEDERIRISAEPIKPRGVVRDDQDGAALLIDRDPRVTEVIAAGVCRCGGALHLLSEVDLTGSKLERLPLRRVFKKGELGKLVAEVLPGLDRRFPVDVQSRRLPRAGGLGRPRIHLELGQREHTLSVTPSLVYGDPPAARIEEGRLVHLGGSEVPARDEIAERALITRLRDELNLVPGRRVDFNGVDAIRFAVRLNEWGGAAAQEAQRALFGAGELRPRFVIDGRAFDVVFELEIPGAEGEGESAEDGTTRRASASAVLRSWQDGLPLVPLDGGGWAPLPTGWLARFGERVADLLAARQDDQQVLPAALPALAELCNDLECPPPPGIERLAPLLDGLASLPEAPLPAGVTATLRPYQRHGVNWLCFLRDAGLGAVLADDMGLGKTLQALCALRGRTLIVCPKSVVHNWADEIRRFRPGLRYTLYHGPKRALDPEADVTLTTYTLLRLDAELLAAEAWDVVILDEAQQIKNPDSQAARAARALRAGFRLALSGTPVENRLEELWSLFHFTNRGLLGGRTDFRDRYERPIENGAPDTAERLRRKVRPFVLRRLKSEVAPELPPRSETVLYCELEEAERDIYEAVRIATRKEALAALAMGGSVLAALEALLRLRQAACHPSLVPGQQAETSSKVTRLLEALEESTQDGHKALVFSQWTSLLDLVEPHLRAAGIPFTRLDGGTRDRAAVVSSFQGAGGPPVMLLSLKAGGVGLNLTAADHVFLLDPWWNPAVEDQAADRAHRIGQDRPVMVHRLVSKDTVEEGILKLQERKRALAQTALGAAEQATALTRDDLLALLE